MELIRNIQFSVIENQQFGNAIVTYRNKKIPLLLSIVFMWTYFMEKSEICRKIRKSIQIPYPSGLSDFRKIQTTIVGGQMKSRFSIVYLTI